MSNETMRTPADVRERVARECVEEAERLRYWYGEWYARAQRLLREAAALLRTPGGEGEAMDADEMWSHWTSGHEDAALQGLRIATDDEAHRFLDMLADWQRCPKPSDHDTPRGEGERGLIMRAMLETFPWSPDIRQEHFERAADAVLTALRSGAQGEEDAVRRTWELAVRRAYGCLDYCGGYRGAELKAFHFGIKTVIKALEAGLDTVDTQTAALDRIGAALRSEARGDAEALAAEILAELRRAREKFPGDNVTTLALVEEVGELAKATFEESRDRVREEAVQVAAMAMRVVLDGDQTLDAWRESKGLDPLTAARRGEGGGE